MGSSLSTKSSWDVVFILLPFGISAGLIVLILACWWKCKILVARSVPGDPEHLDFGQYINIQEYAENQTGTIVIYASPKSSSVPIPYLFSTNGNYARIVSLLPLSSFAESTQRSRMASLTYQGTPHSNTTTSTTTNFPNSATSPTTTTTTSSAFLSTQSNNASEGRKTSAISLELD